VVHADATAMPFEEGRFTGAVSFTMLHHVPTAELQDRLFAEVARVPGPDGVFVASDGVPRDDLAALHHGDTYNPVDPGTVAARLTCAGFADLVRRRRRRRLLRAGAGRSHRHAAARRPEDRRP